MKVLYIRWLSPKSVTAINEIRVEWALFSNNRMAQELAFATLDRVLNHFADNPLANELQVIVAIPSDDVIATLVDAPSQKLRLIDKALPYVMEDMLIHDIDRDLFLHTGKPVNNKLEVVVIEKARLRQFIDTIQTAGLAVDAIYSEAFGLQAKNKELTLFIEKNRVFMFQDAWCHSIVDISQIPLFIRSWASGQIKSSDVKTETSTELPHLKIIVHQDERDSVRRLVKELQQTLNQTDRESWNPEVLSAPAPIREIIAWQLLDQFNKKGFQLLQGEFAPKVRRTPANESWKKIAYLGAASILCFIAVIGYQAYWYEVASSQQAEVNKSQFQKWFPNEPVLDIKRQLEGKISAAGQTSNVQFLSALKWTGSAMDQVRKNGHTLLIEEISFDRVQQSLRVQLALSEFAHADQLKTLLEANNTENPVEKVEIESANRNAEGVQARFNILMRPV
ncbi:MAG: type II secretion system protein GspL [Pseudomonadota bacterium]